MDVTIDTSAWGEFKTGDLPSLVARLSDLRARLVLPLEVLSENLEWDDTWQLVSKIGVVSRDIEVVVFPVLKDMIEIERSGTARGATPAEGQEYTREVLRCCQEQACVASNVEWLREQARAHHAKAEFRAAVAEGRAKAAAYIAVHPEAAQPEFRDAVGRSLIELLARYPQQLLESQSFAPILAALKLDHGVLPQPERFPATLTWGICADLTMYGAVQAGFITPSGGQKAVQWLQSAKRGGDGVDDRIVTASAYSRLFVTDDTYQADKACFAATVLKREVSIVSAAEFLALPISELLARRRPVPPPLGAGQ